jgi:hypothetical protein
MNDMLSPNEMVQATRLTRAGRLTEATALLQRMLRAERPPDMTIGTAGDIVPTGREPPIIDATAKSEEMDRPPSSRVRINSRPAGRPFASAATTAQPHGGNAMPSIRAVPALITSSSLLDCTTGKSADRAPFKIRPVTRRPACCSRHLVTCRRPRRCEAYDDRPLPKESPTWRRSCESSRAAPCRAWVAGSRQVPGLPRRAWRPLQP